MIKRCAIISEDCASTFQGFFVNDGVVYDVPTKRGHIVRYNCKYDCRKHVTYDDAKFDAKMQLWREFCHEIKRICPKFCKSVIWKESLTIKLMFGNYAVYCQHIEQMLAFNVLTVDGRYLRLGELP